ncbi:flagella biosynthesis regulator Flk [Erwinia psidii]|uniref:Flagella biosynthesis regulator Flk n=1 Tax=Erwinia psidii TaxID=69224 RepID=A0A3N6SM92_9GAMM|nr:flagella biosynthesis regulator Flk [Erwinia psidii]MCX8956651.1 flagella biosynthesis regulator Flk [Erwinia psidii]MCX8961439.1 flagella biosynthesis regulator Flk [Erwinia psidii]MCX8965093.1 flagella biosynthesis regulator Flk [Erwinia psidii]RQM39981.1 flagella biosynthesis regulator Flk [Erwinia psidii]
MQPLSGPGAPITGDRTSVDVRPTTLSSGPGNQPLSPAQRTTLERLIVKIISLSSLKSAELWAGVHHEVGVKSDAGLLSQHFPAAEQFLNARLSQVQNTHATRQLFQQLTDLLPQGNNRQAVSDFIRQQFGHTVLSSLEPQQLRQVLTMLQNGQMSIPQPQQNHITDRTLLPAEHHTLNQQVAKLAAATGEHPVKLWTAVLKMVNLHSGDPIPSRVFPLLTQYLQASHMVTQHTALTLPQLLAALKVPPDHAEQKMLEEVSEQRFQLQPQAVLTPAQAQDMINLLFARRAERLREQPVSGSEMDPHPITVPLWAYVPQSLQPLVNRTAMTIFSAVLVLIFLLWIFL